MTDVVSEVVDPPVLDDGGATAPEVDVLDGRRPIRTPDLLQPFVAAGVLVAADVHVARLLGRLREGDESVLLAAALAVRAPRLGHVCTDLATVRSSVASDADTTVDLQALPWPDADEWTATLTSSPLVAASADSPDDRPLRLVGSLLYLDRYWRLERTIAADLRARSAEAIPDVDATLLADALTRLFAAPADLDEPDLQRRAAEVAATRRLAVVAGGPGTGKTTTVARIVAALAALATPAAGGRQPRVALAAPTGKAAARLQEAVRAEAASLDVDDATRAWISGLTASTLHRLLGWRPGSRSRFKHDRSNPLPHDVVIVDETSMVSVSLMAKLVQAVRGDARLVLVGDPHQLASVEAGAVLGDIVGPAATADEVGDRGGAGDTGDTGDTGAGGVAASVVVLRKVHRFGGGIAGLAAAVQRGDVDAALDVLRAGGENGDVRWVAVEPDDPSASGLAIVRDDIVAAAAEVLDAARAGDGRAALTALGAHRLLCAHRRGPFAVTAWTAHVERWLAAALPDHGFGAGGRWYVGRPLLVTENDHALRLYNGDTGVVVEADDGRRLVAFDRGDGGTGPDGGGDVALLSPSRLSAVESVHAMTVHKSQGSQFRRVSVLLPPADSPILTRELLYTAITRARTRLTVAGTEAALTKAITSPVARASGLRGALWAEDATTT